MTATTPTTSSTAQDNTLSDLPSLRCDEVRLTGSPKKVTKQQQRLRVIPSALKGRSSPGEVNRQHLKVNFGPSRLKNASYLPITDPKSEGEVPARILPNSEPKSEGEVPAVLSGWQVRVTAEEAYERGVIKVTEVAPGVAHIERDMVGMKVTATVHEEKARVEEEELTSPGEGTPSEPDVVGVPAATHSYTEENVVNVTGATTGDVATPTNRTRDGIDVISLSGPHMPSPDMLMSTAHATTPQQSAPQPHQAANADHVVQLTSHARQQGGREEPMAEEREEWSPMARGWGDVPMAWRGGLRPEDAEEMGGDTPLTDIPTKVLTVRPSGSARQLDVRIPTMVTAQGSVSLPLDGTSSGEETAKSVSEITPLEEVFSEFTPLEEIFVIPQGEDGIFQEAAVGEEQEVDSFEYTSYSLSLSGGMD